MKRTFLILILLLLYVIYFPTKDIMANSVKNNTDFSAKIISETPELYNGQYLFEYSCNKNDKFIEQKFQVSNEIDSFHKAAKVKVMLSPSDSQKSKFSENNSMILEINALQNQAKSDTLVRIVQARISKSNIGIDGNYKFDYSFNEPIEINSNKIIIRNHDFSVAPVVEFELELWLSICCGYEDKFSLAIYDADKICNTYKSNFYMAKSSNAFSIEAMPNISKSIYSGEYMRISDVNIVEKFPGALAEGKINIFPTSVIALGNKPLIKIEGDIKAEINPTDLSLQVTEKSTETASKIKIENIYIQSTDTGVDSNGELYYSIFGTELADNSRGTKNANLNIDKGPFFGGDIYDYKLIAKYFTSQNFKRLSYFTDSNKYLLEKCTDLNFEIMEEGYTPAGIYKSSINGTPMIPARDFAKAINAELEYDSENKKVIIFLENRKIEFTLWADKIVINGISQNLYTYSGDKAYFEVRDNYVYLPIKCISNTFEVSAVEDGDNINILRISFDFD